MGDASDDAYTERNTLAAALARLYPSGVRKTCIVGWDPAWHNRVFIDLPTGQVSWCFHDRDARLFEGLPEYTKPWDGHSAAEKCRRLNELGRHRTPTPPTAGAGGEDGAPAIDELDFASLGGRPRGRISL